MTRHTTALLLTAALALSACANASRFDNDPGMADANANEIDSSALGALPAPDTPEYFQQAIGDRVFFAVDQSSLTPEGRTILDGQAQWLLTNSDYLAVIEGHADEQGTRDYNLSLGARRANTVMEYLMSQGVAANRLRFVSYGKERPIELCSEEACYAQNRRAVTVIASGSLG